MIIQLAFSTTKRSKTQADQTVRSKEVSQPQEAGNEDLRLVLNTKRKGKKVVFANDPHNAGNEYGNSSNIGAVNIGTSEVPPGNTKTASSTLNDEINSVHDLESEHITSDNPVAVTGIDNTAEYNNAGHVKGGNIVGGISVVDNSAVDNLVVDVGSYNAAVD
ncbi:hypothetical protein Salat_2712200 [Sesamum alatum]|uniref:Uncharacterized protein n=1 Tax=Sesamum alatum TaxID=300844 RepID=A0AAE1XQB4_9LAMI|nr:hypothetical protein Salat_2712200 [Sesamum alatum]